jgi:hypothetical protein
MIDEIASHRGNNMKTVPIAICIAVRSLVQATSHMVTRNATSVGVVFA